MNLPSNLTIEMIADAVERNNTSLDNPGFCLECGSENEGCEPDLRKGECEICGARAVYGAEELLIRYWDARR